MQKLSEDNLQKIIYCCISKIKNYEATDFKKEQYLVKDFHLESLDLVDFLFEIQKLTNIDFTLNEFSEKMMSGPVLNDITINEFANFLFLKTT